MVKEKNLTGIDIVTPTTCACTRSARMRRAACPISFPSAPTRWKVLGARVQGTLGVDEMGIAGACAGAPVPLGQCGPSTSLRGGRRNLLEAKSCPSAGPAEGRFGEFTGLMAACTGPQRAHQRLMMRKAPIYYALHMPWKYLAGRPTRYQAIRRALRTAGVQVKDINVTFGGRASGTP